MTPGPFPDIWAGPGDDAKLILLQVDCIDYWSLWLLVVVIMSDIMIVTYDICALNCEFCLQDPLLEVVIVIKHLNDA